MYTSVRRNPSGTGWTTDYPDVDINFSIRLHNTDIDDAWEREGEDPRYFLEFGPNGYGLGINVILYALSH
jgi:hypothetical protein